MDDHITSFNQLVTDLINMDEVFKDQDLALIMLGSLSEEYDLLETTLLNGMDDVSFSKVCAALYSKDLIRKDKKISSSHWKRDCPTLKTKNNYYKGKAVACSGANNEDGTIVTLKGVRYSPKLKKNLISVGTLESKRFKVRAKDGVMKIISGVLVVMKGIRKINNTYHYKGRTVVGTVAFMMRYFTFGRHLEELHVTWAHLEKKRTRLRTYTNISQEDLALYDNESWNDPRDFAKPDKAIALPQDVPMVLTTLGIAWKIPSKPFVEYASSRTNEAGGKWYTFKPEQNNLGEINNPSWKSHPNLRTEENEEEERCISKNHPNSPTPPDPSISFVTEKVLKINSLFESLRLVPPSPNPELVCTKKEDGDVIFIEIMPKEDNFYKEEPKPGVQEVEYFIIFPTRSELAYHK
ncbi:hypothetical protein Tco_1376320 [Tanacetum coccineum]